MGDKFVPNFAQLTRKQNSLYMLLLLLLKCEHNKSNSFTWCVISSGKRGISHWICVSLSCRQYWRTTSPFSTVPSLLSSWRPSKSGCLTALTGEALLNSCPLFYRWAYNSQVIATWLFLFLLVYRSGTLHPPLVSFKARCTYLLQVLLSQVHRLRALDLLGRFLDLGPWAVSLVRKALPSANGSHHRSLAETRILCLIICVLFCRHSLWVYSLTCSNCYRVQPESWGLCWSSSGPRSWLLIV